MLMKEGMNPLRLDSTRKTFMKDTIKRVNINSKLLIVFFKEKAAVMMMLIVVRILRKMDHLKTATATEMENDNRSSKEFLKVQSLLSLKES